MFYGSTYIRCKHLRRHPRHIRFYYPHHAKKVWGTKKWRVRASFLSEMSWICWTLNNFILWSIGSFTSIIVLHIKATTARRHVKITFVPTRSFYFFLYEQAGSTYKMPSVCQWHKGNPRNLTRPIILSYNMVQMMLKNTLEEQNPFSGPQNMEEYLVWY